MTVIHFICLFPNHVEVEFILYSGLVLSPRAALMCRMISKDIWSANVRRGFSSKIALIYIKQVPQIKTSENIFLPKIGIIVLIRKTFFKIFYFFFYYSKEVCFYQMSV